MADLVRFMYLRDKKDPQHVLSLGRFVKNDMVIYSFCLNKRKKNLLSWEPSELDEFSKKRAREILIGRLNKDKSTFVVLLYDNKSIEAMLNHAVNNEALPHSARKIVRQTLKR